MKNALPILADILCMVDEERKTITMTGSDSEAWLTYQVQLQECEGGGPFCIGADLLRDVSDNFEISLTMDYTVHQDEPQADNETLAKRIEDCNLSVRTTNICKANGIDTLGDLCKLHKIDWLKFRNGGKKSLMELDDLLAANGLEWAKC